MNKYFRKVFYIIAVSVLLVVFVLLYIGAKIEARRYKENFSVEITKEFDRQQTLTKKEFKTYFADIADTLKNYGIKPKQVENVISVHYIYKDTLIAKEVLVFRDTLIAAVDTVYIDRFAVFEVQSHCHTVKGLILGDVLQIDSIETTDNLLISLYKEKQKCLFKKRRVRAIAVSECKGDTLTVVNNLKINN